MQLLDWMRRERVDDEEMARRVGGCTAHAVKKWMYGERVPSPGKILRIEEVTAGDVTMRDLLGRRAAA